MLETQCRVCLHVKPIEICASLFSKHGDTTTAELIMTCASVQIMENDGFPNQICSECLQSLQNALDFIHAVQLSDQTLRKLSKFDDADKQVEVFQYEEYVSQESIKCEQTTEAEDVQVNKPNDVSNVFTCILCEEMFECKRKYSEHIENTHVKYDGDRTIVECNRCSKTFSKYGYVRTHIYEMHLNQKRRLKRSTALNCLHCDAKFSCLRNFNMHMKKKHASVDEKKKKREVTCKDCNVTFKNNRTLRDHTASAHKLTKQEDVKMEVGKENEEEMIERKVGRHKCMLCDAWFTLTSKFSQHIDKEHAVLNPLTRKKEIKCPSCSKNFPAYKNFRMHNLLIHLHDQKKKKRKYSRPPVVCIICNERSANSKLLREHVNAQHTQQFGDERKIPCSLCDMKFYSYGPIIAHMRMAHQKYTPNSRTLKKSKLNGEISKPYLCPRCGIGFADSANCKRHVMIHEGNRPFKCSECKKSYTTRSDLAKHTLKVHSNVKAFGCEQCPKRFAVWDQLQKHALLHIDTRNYSCDVCGRTYKTKKNADSHKKIHGPKTYICAFCFSAFSMKKYLLNHLKNHSKFANACTRCTEQFLTEEAMRQHVLDMHSFVGDDHKFNVKNDPN